jgi:hypothetical protein
VTLDDTTIAPIGADIHAAAVTRRVGSMSRLGKRIFTVGASVIKVVAWIGGFGLVGSAAVIAATSAGGPQDRLVTVINLTDRDGGGAVGTVLRLSLVAVLGCLAVVMAAGVVALAYLVASPALTFLSLMGNGIKEAERTKAIRVQNGLDVVTVRDLVDVVSRRVFGARLVVLKVDNKVWQAAVIGFGYTSAVSLIDVSHPTDHVLWEIRLLSEELRRRCVFVVHRDQAEYLARPAKAGSVDAQLQTLIDGCQVLAYTTDDRGVRRFTRALRATLEERVRAPLPTMEDPLTPLVVVVKQTLKERERERLRRARHVNWREVFGRVVEDLMDDRRKR